jgi:Leucine-rich repeat (LRR) protein
MKITVIPILIILAFSSKGGFAQERLHIITCADFDSLAYNNLFLNTKLKELYIGECALITHLPKNIERLKLKVLHFYWIGLGDETVDYTPVGHITTLKHLKLGPYTQLKILPESFKNLKKLEKLDVHMAYISILPSWIKELKNLKELNLNGTKIEDLPSQVLINMKKLKSIEIKDTPLSKNTERLQQIATELKTKGIKLVY